MRDAKPTPGALVGGDSGAALVGGDSAGAALVGDDSVLKDLVSA
jgi:hypothetical protein